MSPRRYFCVGCFALSVALTVVSEIVTPHLSVAGYTATFFSGGFAALAGWEWSE